MSVSTRNRIAGYMAIVGGILILIGGGTGMAGFLQELSDIIQEMLGSKNQTIETIFWILIVIAALGGLAVIIGGLLFLKNYIIVGKILIALGAGFGIIGLILGLISAVYQGDELKYFAWLTTSLMGIGFILSLIARFVAKRPSADKQKSKKR